MFLTLTYDDGAGCGEVYGTPHTNIATNNGDVTVTLYTPYTAPNPAASSTPSVCFGAATTGVFTTVLPTGTTPAQIIDGGCKPGSAKGETSGPFRSVPGNPAPPPDNPCLPGSPKVRSAVADTCDPLTSSTSPSPVVPSATIARVGAQVDLTLDVHVAFGRPCHYDSFVAPMLYINTATQHFGIQASPSWGVDQIGDLPTGTADFVTTWAWTNWCRPVGTFVIGTYTEIAGNSNQTPTTLHPTCTSPNTVPTLTLVAASQR